MEHGGSSGPGGVARPAFDREKRNRPEGKVHEPKACWQGVQEATALKNRRAAVFIVKWFFGIY
jgi:hypothetical protein